MAIRAFVFDMDGTILHSLPDLAIATNEALERQGYPTHTYDEIMSYMGNGAQKLIERALPPGTPANVCQRTFELWRAIYLQSDYANTAPFPGIIDTLRELRRRDMKTGILSNKFDAGVRSLAEQYFPGLFDAVRGEIPPAPRKPDPTTLLQMLDALGVQPEETIYVGDLNIDRKTARNAGCTFAAVSWGYAKASPLPVEALDHYIHDPGELLALLDA